MKDLISSSGLEIEVEDVLPEALKKVTTETFNFNLTHDASCERNEQFLGKYPVSNVPKRFQPYLKRERVGFEIVTSIIDTDNEKEFLKDLTKITDALSSAGESQHSFRAGIHCHINMAVNTRILKKLAELGSHLEQVFFLLGGMGYEYRGSKNDSTYCRPITKFGPPCVKYKSSFAQVFNTNDLYKAQNSTEFGERYGDIFIQGGKHYFPVRYTWLNLSRLFFERLGSLEFRIFNKSLNPEKIVAVMEFCRLFSQAAILESIKPTKKWEENSIYDIKTRDNILDTFSSFIEDTGLAIGEKNLDILKVILKQTPLESIILPQKYIYSHLMYLTRGDATSNHWEKSKYKPETIPSNKISVPKFVDIHVLEEGRE